MNRSVFRFALLFLSFAVFPARAAEDYSRWMTDNWNTIKGKTLRRLVIPGTHDSGAWNLINPWELFDPRRGEIAGIGDSHEKFAAPDTALAADYFASGIFVEHWSQTQNRSIYEQLTDGIRHIDLRVAADAHGTFRAVHSLYGDTIDLILDQAKQFTTENPGELILLRFDHFHDAALRTATNWTGGTDKMLAAHHAALIQLIQDKIGDRLISAWSPTMTLDSLRAAGSSRRILLSYNIGSSAVNPDGSPASITLPATFGGTSAYAGGDWVSDTIHLGDPAIFKTKTREKLVQFFPLPGLHRMGAVTPTKAQYDAWYQDGGIGFGGTNPKTLEGYAGDTNPRVAKWITEEWSGLSLNIIQMDFYPDYLVPLCLRLNGITVPDYTIPTDTDWGNYQTLSEIAAASYEVAATWTTTAVADVGNWFDTAWTDVSTFFTTTADAIADVFYEREFPPALAGVAPTTPVAAGVRHYQIRSIKIAAGEPLTDGGDFLEMYGEVFMVPPPAAKSDTLSNSTFWSRPESDPVPLFNGAVIPFTFDTLIPHTKNLYIKEADAAGASVALGGWMAENDASVFPGGGDTKAQSSLTVALGPMAENETRSFTVPFSGDGLSWTVQFQVERLVAPLIPVNPPFTWTTAAPGTLPATARVGEGPLQASSPVAGTITYSPPAGSLLAPGQRVQVSASFTPADTRRYTDGRLITRTVNTEGIGQDTSGWPVASGTVQVQTSPSFALSLSPATTPGTTLDLANSNSGDYFLDLPATNDAASGVLITTVAANGTTGAWFTSSMATDSAGRNSIAVHTIAPGAVEGNVATSFAWFPYTGWLGGVALNDNPGSGGPITRINGLPITRIDLGPGRQFADGNDGTATLDLTAIRPDATPANGILLVNGAANDNNFAISEANPDGRTFTIYNHDNAADGNLYEQDPVSFVYISRNDLGRSGLTAMGRVNSNGTRDVEAGTFTLTKGGEGIWYLAIPGHSGSTGTLIVTASSERSPGWALDNIVSCAWDPAASRWEIQSRDLRGGTTAPVLQNSGSTTEDMFSFAFFASSPPVATVTWNTPAAIPYGSPLGAGQLSATANVPGTFTYSPAAGTRLPAGNAQTLSTVFTPADPLYSAVTESVLLDVNKAPLTITADNKGRGPGIASVPLTLTYSGLVNGDTFPAVRPTLSTTATAASPAGPWPIVVTGGSDPNYLITRINGTLTIYAETPATMEAFRGQNGVDFCFTITGNAEGAIYGTDIYTDDSLLAAAAVHAGILQPGQTGLVRVTVLPGQSAYPDSTRNGVTSNAWGEWTGSYSLSGIEAPWIEIERATGPLAATHVIVSFSAGGQLQVADSPAGPWTSIPGATSSPLYLPLAAYGDRVFLRAILE